MRGLDLGFCSTFSGQPERTDEMFGLSDLYIAGAGIRPSSAVCFKNFSARRPHTVAYQIIGFQLPICLDMGTSTEKYLNDPLYIGVRRTRPSPEEVRVA